MRAFGCALWLGLAGCAHHGLTMPGPTRTVGRVPPNQLDAVPEEETSSGAGLASARRSGPSLPEATRRSSRAARRLGERVARAAVAFEGRQKLSVHGQHFRPDCSGFACAAYARAGLPLDGNTAALHALAKRQGVLHHRKRPEPGDLAFFDDTWDRNGNGRRDDELTHVAVVERVSEDGTITLVHFGNQGVVEIRMNLRHPHEHTGPRGQVWNDYLRSASNRDGGPELSGELWRDFGSLWKVGEATVPDRR